MSLKSEGIYVRSLRNQNIFEDEQVNEREFRQVVAQAAGRADINEIGKSHSVHVMDREVSRFLECIPPNGVILDVGGGWGWHWREVQLIRSDVTLVIVDLATENLILARDLLGHQCQGQVFLVEGDVRELRFHKSTKFTGFEGVWSVQTLQHVRQFELAVQQIYSNLKTSGVFWNYSVAVQPHFRLIKRFIGGM